MNLIRGCSELDVRGFKIGLMTLFRPSHQYKIEKKNHHILRHFDTRTDHSVPSDISGLIIAKKKKIAVRLEAHRLTMKLNVTLGKILEFVRVLKNVYVIWSWVLPVNIGAPGTVLKRCNRNELELDRRVETL